MEIPISIPLDDDGFLRRQCPNCGRHFKWHSGPANEEAESHTSPDEYHCPLCGKPASNDSWWTEAQKEYAQAQAAPEIARYMDQALGDVFKNFRSDFIRIEQTKHLDIPDAPAPQVEPNDMEIVMSPCHPYEPVKVPDDHAGILFCLVCGDQFAV